MDQIIHCVAWALVLLLVAGTAESFGQLKPGQEAPLFVLKNDKGKSYELAQMKDQPMVIVYFFDVDSSSSQEGLLHLDQLAKKYKDADLTVWGSPGPPKVTSRVFCPEAN